MPSALLASVVAALCRTAYADEIPVAPGTSVNAAIASASEGDRIVLDPGRYFESVVINKPVTVAARQGGTATIEHCEFSNFPLYTLSYHRDYATQRKNYRAKGLDSEVTCIRIGSLSSQVRHNCAYEMADGIQPRKMQPSDASQRTYIYHNFIRNSWDDGVELDSNGPQNLRMHHNVILNALCAVAPSRVNFGPVSFDHNLVLHTRQHGMRKCTMFKFDGSWSKKIHRSLRIVHNTVTGWPSHGLYWCEPLGADSVVCANNILDITGRKRFPKPFTSAHNSLGAPGFVRTTPSLS